MNFYEKNLKALTQVAPTIAEMLEKTEMPPWVSLIDSKTPNLLIKSGPQQITIAHPDNPYQLVKDTVKQMPLHREDVSVIVGMGYGYLIEQMLKKAEKGHIIICVEPVLFFVKKAFERCDFSKYIASHQLVIAPTKSEIAELIGTFDSIKVVQQWHLTLERYTQIRREYQEMIAYTHSLISQLLCNTGTVSSAGAKIAQNDIETLPYIIRHRGVKELAGLYQGKPAVLVSTGPSLQKNIHLLQQYQKKCVIIAVGQALRILQAYDIKPDFICSVDYGEVNLVHYQGLMDTQDVPLVLLNRSYADLAKQWQGNKFIVVSPVPGYEGTACGVLQEKGSLEQGGSVAHLCLSLAVHLGCSPIAMIGQDLALSETSHSPQADAMGNVKTENGTINWEVTDQSAKTLHGKSHSMGPVTEVPGYFGKPVLTNVGLASFITAFESMLDRIKIPVFNCTEGGARINGACQKSLMRYLKEYAAHEIDKSAITPLLSHADNAVELIEQVKPLLKSEADLLQTIIDQTSEGLETCKKMKEIACSKSHKRGAQLKELLFQNEKASIEAHEAVRKNVLITMSIYGASRAIQSREMKAKSSIKDLLKYQNKQHLLKRIERNELILMASKSEAEKLLKLYQESIQGIEKEPAIQIEPVPDVEGIEAYFEKGNFAKPLSVSRAIIKQFPDNEKALRIYQMAVHLRNKAIVEAEEVLQEDVENKVHDRIEYVDLIETVRKAGPTGDMEQGLKKLEQAHQLFPDAPEAHWGLATTYYALGRHKESLMFYDKIIASIPQDTKLRFEKALVMLADNQIDDALKLLSEIMKETHAHDHFLLQISKLYLQLGKIKEAELAVNEYVERFPQDPEGHALQKQIKFKTVNPPLPDPPPPLPEFSKTAYLKQNGPDHKMNELKAMLMRKETEHENAG